MRRICALMCVICMLVTLITGCGKEEQDDNKTEGTKEVTKGAEAEVSPESSPAEEKESGVMRENMTAMDIVYDMGLGWNLGNSLEATGNGCSSVYQYETCWGNPMTTPAMIEKIKEAGFDSIRVPVSWSNLMSEDYTISADLMARVKVVVDCCLENGLYVVLNIHWDGGWWSGFSTDYDECMKKYVRIWEQITEEFKDYGDYLILESLNEEGCFDDLWNRYSGSDNGKADAYGILNNLNQKFVDIVRASGSNNATRHLLLAGYATDFELTCDDAWVLPTDTIADHLIVSVHYYTPSTFAILTNDADWGKVQTDWGSDTDYSQLESLFNMLSEHFVANNVPVIIGEYGSATAGKAEGAVTRYISSVASAAWTRGMCPMLWDAGGHFDRKLLKFKDATMLETLMKVKTEARPE